MAEKKNQKIVNLQHGPRRNVWHPESASSTLAPTLIRSTFTYIILIMNDHECTCGLEECEANKSVSKE